MCGALDRPFGSARSTASAAVAQSSELSGAFGQVQASGGAMGTVEGGGVREVAHAGLTGASKPLPHLERIQKSFGAHDISGVETFAGGGASRAAGMIGARAYTSGERIAFGTTPDLHTAAHEAAHVVQQRAGVSLPGGVGRPGDRYERHADAVADKVVKGDSAQALLGGGEGGGTSAATWVQMEPTDAEPILNDRQVSSAVSYNGARGMPADAWAKIAAIVGSDSSELGTDLVQKLAAWQKAKGLGTDGKAGNVTTQWLAQSGGAGLEAYVKSDATVYLGINPVSRKTELAKIKAVAGASNVTGVIGAKNDTASVGGATVDLTTEQGLATFAQSLDRFDPARQDAVMDFLRYARDDSRDELAQYLQILYATETGQRLIKRVVLSGHSGGWSISGDTGNDTSVSFSHLKKLSEIFPMAHGQVEDLMLSACNTGQRSKLGQFTEIYPNLRSVWAYVGYSPSAATGSLKHIASWEKASRGTIDASRMDLARAGISTQSGIRDKNVAVWTKDAGGKEAYQTASPEAAMDYDTMRGVVDSNIHHFHTAFKDGNINQAELNSLYTYLQNLVGNFAYRLGSERESYERIMKQTLYLRHWKKVSEKFIEEFGGQVRSGYGEQAMPNYAGASRDKTLGYIAAYPKAGDAAHQLLTSYLRDLDPSLIPDTWY